MNTVVAVPVITIFVYVIIELLKRYIVGEIFKRLIPLISCLLGAICGLLVFFLIPNYLPAENWFVALVLGLVSGASSTAANQVGKQLELLSESLKNTKPSVELNFEVRETEEDTPFMSELIDVDGVADDEDDEH